MKNFYIVRTLHTFYKYLAYIMVLFVIPILIWGFGYNDSSHIHISGFMHGVFVFLLFSLFLLIWPAAISCVQNTYYERFYPSKKVLKTKNLEVYEDWAHEGFDKEVFTRNIMLIGLAAVIIFSAGFTLHIIGLVKNICPLVRVEAAIIYWVCLSRRKDNQGHEFLSAKGKLQVRCKGGAFG